MIARTLCFSSRGRISLRDNQLVWSGEDGAERTVPIEDTGFVILETDRIEVSSSVLRALSENNVAVVVCDGSHTPLAQLVPYASHTVSAETVEAQFAATEAVQGRLWRKLCRAKIRNQAALMRRLGKNADKLEDLALAVKNGDPSNCEAQAARIYFQSLGDDGFVRDREGVWPNAALNYGYAILRAAVARALVGSGLLCIRGIHHHNRYNAFALADDVMEPYRPYVDQYIFGRVRPFDVPSKGLEKEHRARLLQMLTCDVKVGGVQRPLMIALSSTSASLAKYYRGETEDLALPEFR